MTDERIVDGKTRFLAVSRMAQSPRFDVEVQLSGEDGNAGAIMGNVVAGLKEAGASREEIMEYRKESMSGDYDNLLRVADKWVIVL